MWRGSVGLRVCGRGVKVGGNVRGRLGGRGLLRVGGQLSFVVRWGVVDCIFRSGQRLVTVDVAEVERLLLMLAARSVLYELEVMIPVSL